MLSVAPPFFPPPPYQSIRSIQSGSGFTGATLMQAPPCCYTLFLSSEDMPLSKLGALPLSTLDGLILLSPPRVLAPTDSYLGVTQRQLAATSVMRESHFVTTHEAYIIWCQHYDDYSCMTLDDSIFTRATEANLFQLRPKQSVSLH